MPASHSMRLPGSRGLVPGKGGADTEPRAVASGSKAQFTTSANSFRQVAFMIRSLTAPGSVTARSGGQNVRTPTTSCRLSYSPRAFQKPQCQLFRPCLWRLLYRPPSVLLLYGRHSKGYLLWLRDYERSLLL